MDVIKRLTPKQRRTIREKVNQKKKVAKTARLLNLPQYNCSPRIKENVSEFGKSPRTISDPDSIMGCLVKWCQSRADIIGQWSWKQPRKWEDDDWKFQIGPKLLEFEKLKWSEIFAQRTGGKKKRHKLHHDMDVCRITPEACNRWHEIGLEEYDTAFRFRLAGKRRLWGYKILEKFHLIWWDPKHKIYPTEVQ